MRDNGHGSVAQREARPDLIHLSAAETTQINQRTPIPIAYFPPRIRSPARALTLSREIFVYREREELIYAWAATAYGFSLWRRWKTRAYSLGLRTEIGAKDNGTF